MVRMQSVYDDFVRTFGNVLFAVLLFLIWGVLTLIGVIVDQGKDPGVYFQSYAPPIARAILRLHFDNIYHTPYYVGIIGLILLSLAVCTFKRVIPARLPRLHPVKIEAIPLHATIDVRGDVAGVRERVARFFADRGWQVRKREFGGTEWTFADRHNWARRGVLVAHLGFVIIAAGTTLYWARGFSGDAAIVSGQTVAIPHTKTTIRLDGFKYTIKPIMTKGGIVYQPIDYVSRVTVVGKSGIPKNETIRVNHPINVDGTLYYQSSYGFAMRFDVTHDGERDATLSDRVYEVGDQIAIPGSTKSLQYVQFVPTVDRQTGLASPDPRVNDPAVAMQLYEAGVPAAGSLVPLHAGVDLGDGWRLTPARYLIVSGIQYRYDPGVPLVGIGAFVLLAGLVIAFYLLPARLFVRVDPVAAGASGAAFCRIGLAATTVKGYDIFETSFYELVAQFERALQAAPAPHSPVLAEAT